MRTTWCRHLGGFVCALAVLAGPAHAQDPDTHWLSLINWTHRNPTGMIVLVVPPVFVSAEAMTSDPNWIGPDALRDHPGVQAALEAIDYWDWMLHDGPYSRSHLDGLSWTTKILGVDATPEDIAGASIIVNTAMVTDPLPFLFHAGVGLPTLPIEVLFSGPSDAPQDVCTVWNTGIGGDPDDQEPARLRNLIVHEFGHCISAGHTGTSLGLDHTSNDGTVYENHPTDIMSIVAGDTRQCLSNLNVQSVAEGYAFLPGPWQPHDGETFVLKSDYKTACMPGSLERF